MNRNSCYRVLLDPTPEQAKSLALQIVAVNKIIQGCPRGTGNPFGQSKTSFKIQHGVELWASVNTAMMGFSEKRLLAPEWKRQINYRGCGKTGLQLYYGGDPAVTHPSNAANTTDNTLALADWGIYIPQLDHEAGLGRVRAIGEPLHLPSAVRPMYMTIGVSDDKRWWANVYATSRPPQTYAKRRY